MLDLIGNGRPAEDLLSRVVRIRLAGTEYALPTLTIRGNREWRAALDARLSGMLDGLENGGNDVGVIFAVLSRQIDDLLDLLIQYDSTHILPGREVLEETVYEDELLAAVREVWRAANPLVVMGGLDSLMTTGQPVSASSPPTNSPPRNGAGSRKRSKKN